MTDHLNIIFDSVDRSDALEDRIRKRAEKLQRHYSDILSCEVRVAAVDRRHHQGGAYRVNINVHIPNRQFVVSHDPGDQDQHDDPYVAVRDAFDAIQRQMEDFTTKRRQTQRH